MAMNNGSGTNGSGMAPKDSGKIVKLPTLAERDRMRKEKEKAEGQKKNNRQPTKTPFFNLRKILPFTGAMICAFIAVHLVVFVALNPAQRLEAFYTMGFVPGYFTGAMGDSIPWFAPVGLFSHMFIHSGWLHLLVNVAMMVALALPFESTYGTRRTVIFFFLCGIAGALFYFALSFHGTIPIIGASGGISGLFAGMLMYIVGRPEYASLNRRGPWPIIAFWAVFMTGISILSGDNIAWQAHLGGFLAGIGLTYLIQKKKIRL